ncbi:MAG: phytanoyl-CoA dioxygenase family protein [Acidimicrobiales bacterium]|nr:phytanoyl-CoA dioxygenase family protein [Acidimicrobiales bacterium]
MLRSTEDHLADIARDGYTIVRDAFPAERADELVAGLERLEAELAVAPARNSFEGAATWRVYNLLARGELFWPVPLHPAVLPIVEGVLDRGCLVSSLSSIAIGPGEQAQPIHGDDALHPIPRPHPATVCNSMWALTDFTEENGATRLVPGSHTADHTPPYGARPESIAAEMPKGSILVWHGSLWHGGGANRTDRRRYGLAMNYCAGWVRQQENQQLGIPLEHVRRFPPRLAELCGFGLYKGLVGHIERRTPAEHLLGDDRLARPIIWDKVG